MDRGYRLVHDSTPLRLLIAENPDLPVVILVDEESACFEYSWTYCSSVSCHLAWILDIKTPYDSDEGCVFTDKDEFKEAIIDVFADDERYSTLPDEAFEEAVKREMDKYESSWQRVIAIYASN